MQPKFAPHISDVVIHPANDIIIHRLFPVKHLVWNFLLNLTNNRGALEIIVKTEI